MDRVIHIRVSLVELERFIVESGQGNVSPPNAYAIGPKWSGCRRDFISQSSMSSQMSYNHNRMSLTF